MGKPFDKTIKNENETASYDDHYLFYNYIKWTNFQAPLIIHCRWILDLCSLLNILRNFKTKNIRIAWLKYSIIVV